jgi:hypothetical protein
MKKWMINLTALTAATLGANASADVLGQFTLTESGATLNDPGDLSVVTADVYQFQIVNDTGFDIFSFENLQFSGQFLQGNTTSKQGSDFEQIAIFTLADTFFFNDANAPTTTGTVTDDATSLSTDAIASLGTPYIPNGQTEGIAVLAVAPGTLPTFNFGDANAVVDGQRQSIVPEPASLVLLGLGGLALAGGRQRRRG